MFVIGYIPFILLGFSIIHSIVRTTLIFDLVNLLTLLYLSGASIIFWRYHKISSELIGFMIFAAIALGLLFNSVVLNIDRSRSFYVLGWVRSDEIRLENAGYDLSLVHSEEKLSKKAITVRINEQISRGLIRKDSHKISVSLSGKVITSAADSFAKFFHLAGWFSNNY